MDVIYWSVRQSGCGRAFTGVWDRVVVGVIYWSVGQSGCGREFTGVWDRVVVGVHLVECGTEWLWA